MSDKSDRTPRLVKRLAGRAARGVDRRATLAGLASLTLSTPAVAQVGNWWEKILGPTSSNSSSARNNSPRPRRVEPLNDLRSNQVPFRSDAMVDAIVRAVARYQQIVAKGGWQPIPGTRAMRPGDDDERIPLVRRRLFASGELKSASAGWRDFTFNSALEAAVVEYQRHNGLRVSGRVDRSTIAAMNVPAEQRLRQLQVNEQRLRELLAGRVEDRYVLVNVPAFQLEAVDRFQVEQRHRVIVGREQRQTPVLKATIKALNFFPYWRVPESVATLDLIPKLQKEPGYLEQEKIRVLQGDFNGPEINASTIDWRMADPKVIRFRQDPGPQNALGLVRIDMPNSEGVYMHDTPMKPLFDQRARAFSAGCVRVQDVFKLVAWIARPEGVLDEARIEEVLAAGQGADLTLQRPVPVYFAYISAWSEPNGQIEFRPDLYGRDGARELAGEADPEAAPPTDAARLAP